MAIRPRRMNVAKALRLACWNANGVSDRKLELEHFLSQHGVDICILTETHLRERERERERETSFGLQTMSVTEQTGPQKEAEQQYWSTRV
jgi:exonuclease III